MESLALRLKALEAEHFVIVAQIRNVADAGERNANLLDDFEEILTDLAVSSAENTEVMAAAMAQRQAQLDLDNAADPAAGAVAAGAADTGAADTAPPEFLPVSQANPALPSAKPAATAPPAGGPQMPDLAALHAWVEDHIAPMVRKVTTTGEGGGIRWCRQWWEHIDAVERFIALYLAWEELSQEDSATWLSVYLRDHLDPHLSTLTSPYGPFYACIPTKHSETAQAIAQADLPASRPSTSRQP
jgi:hypothetical protein